MKVLAIIISFILLISCSKQDLNYSVEIVNGIKHIRNKNVPSKPNLNIQLKKLFSLKGYDDSLDSNSESSFQDLNLVDIDSKQNIYILPANKSEIKKFDRDGNFLINFGKSGTGPGETRWPQGLYVQNDTVNVLNQSVLQMVKYDSDGNFIENVSTQECKMPVYTQTVGNDKILTYFCNWSQVDGENVMDYDLGIAESDYRIIKRIKKQSYTSEELQNKSPDLLYAASVSRDQIFMSENNVDEYKVNAYDHNGNKQYTFSKNHRKIKGSPINREEQTGVKGDFAKPVIDIVCDNKGRAWCVCAVERNEENKDDFIVDVFEDGIFQNRVKLDLPFNSEKWWLFGRVFIRGNRFYVADGGNNELLVYEYDVKEQ